MKVHSVHFRSWKLIQMPNLKQRHRKRKKEKRQKGFQSHRLRNECRILQIYHKLMNICWLPVLKIYHCTAWGNSLPEWWPSDGCQTMQQVNATRWLMPAAKGQLISELIYEVIISPKIRTKNCQDFCPHYIVFRLYFGRNDDFIN